jgi:hypothetical protein
MVETVYNLRFYHIFKFAEIENHPVFGVAWLIPGFTRNGNLKVV